MKKYIFCGFLVCLMLVCVFSTAAQATDELPTDPQATESSTEPTQVTEPATEPSTQPSTILEGICGADARWQLDEATGVLTISGSGAMGGYNSTMWLSYRDNIKSIVIEPGITTICAEAFTVCNYATSVSIPATVVRIEDKAFRSCTHLTSVQLPASLTYLGNSVFEHCLSLRQVNLPPNLTNYGGRVFATCQKLTSFEIPSSWTQIPNGMFSDSGLVEITIPAGIRSIGQSAFSGCTALDVIRFEGNAPDIQPYAFYRVKASVTYPADNSTWTADKMQNYEGDLTWLPAGGSGVQVEGTFGNSDIMSWKIDGSTLYITGNGYMSGWNAVENPPWYDYRGHITKVVMSGNMQNIYTRAFAGCTKLSEVVWPSGIITIFNSAFNGCSSLKTLVIPNSVQHISGSAFRGCTGLTSITLPQSLTEIDDYVFDKCTSLQSITIPSGVRSMLQGAFNNCTALKTVYFTGKLPRFTEIGVGYIGTFGGIRNVTVYYNSWPADQVQALNSCYAAANVSFVQNNQPAPGQPTEPETPDSTAPTMETQPGTVPTAPEETQTDPTSQAGSETATAPAATESATPPDSSATPGDSAKPEKDTDQENSSNGFGWVAVGVSVAAIAALATGITLWKKKK